MSARTLKQGWWMTLTALAGLCAGCGKSEQPSPAAAIANPTAKADLDDEDDDADEGTKVAAENAPAEGTPEWMVREAMRLRLEPPPQTEDVERLKAHRKERNEQIIKLCQAAIAKIHDDKERVRVFNFAVQNMLEARLQQALAGDRESIDALYEDAAALAKRDPASTAAGEGALALVNLAYNRAKLGGSDHAQWLHEFVKQAMHYASSFPFETHRSLPLLYTAARSCELGGLTNEAIEAYTLLAQKFASSPYAPRAAAVLRRLKLPGNPPQLSGPTPEGDVVVLDDLLGKAVLVAFWSSEARPFVDALPGLLDATRDLPKEKLQVIGVNVDTDPTAAQQFIVKYGLTWPQILFAEPGQQGWNNPIAVYYGLMEVPAYWLIDQSGNVVSTSLTADAIPSEVGKLLGAASTADAESPARDPGTTRRKNAAKSPN